MAHNVNFETNFSMEHVRFMWFQMLRNHFSCLLIFLLGTALLFGSKSHMTASLFGACNPGNYSVSFCCRWWLKIHIPCSFFSLWWFFIQFNSYFYFKTWMGSINRYFKVTIKSRVLPTLSWTQCPALKLAMKSNFGPVAMQRCSWFVNSPVTTRHSWQAAVLCQGEVYYLAV